MLKEFILNRTISKLVKTNPNQLTFDEYAYIANFLLKKKGCNLLVYGVGNDSKLWLKINKSGNTVFLENSIPWLTRVRDRIPSITVFLIKYTTALKNWKQLLNQSSSNLLIELPKTIKKISWDVVFIDGPAGCHSLSPGRMQSIYTTSVLIQKSKIIDVFVHDCDRIVEQEYCDRFFTDLVLVAKFDRLRHYRKINKTEGNS